MTSPKYFSSFNGETLKTEASSKFPHNHFSALGSYRNSPFVTGQYSSTQALYTEILDYAAQKWEQVANYPFAGNGNWYVHGSNGTSKIDQ